MPKILLAEDDTDMRRFLVKALQNAGFDVTSYDNGLSAYQRLREEPFQLLLTDIVMPEMDGIELARRVVWYTGIRAPAPLWAPEETGPGMHPSKDEFDPPFEILEPENWDSPAVFNSPHSGRIYPSDFLVASRLDLAALRRSEDSFVDDLILGVVKRGHPLMRAHFPRCYVDVNREPYELDQIGRAHV